MRKENVYEIMHLPLADLDMLEAEEYLSEFSPTAADKLSEAYEQQTDDLHEYPFMYKIYEPKPYFRCMPLPYDYLCFYHIDEKANVVRIHRILRGMQDIENIL